MIKDLLVVAAPKPVAFKAVARFFEKALLSVLDEAHYEKYGKFDTTMEFDEWQDTALKLELRTLFQPNPVPTLSVSFRHFRFKSVLEKLGYTRIADSDDEGVEVASFINTKIKSLGWVVTSIAFAKNLTTVIHLSPRVYAPIKVPSMVYHMSPLWNKDKIKRKGVLPRKSKWGTDFVYSERVYALTHLDLSLLRELALSMGNHLRGGGEPSSYDSFPIVVFGIDTHKLRPGTKWYQDPHVKYGCWTPTHIPREALTIIYQDSDQGDAQ